MPEDQGRDGEPGDQEPDVAIIPCPVEINFQVQCVNEDAESIKCK